MASKTFDEKVLRLLADGCVREDPAPVRAMVVDGDHGNYMVVVGPHVQMCTCPAVGRCTHIEAAVARVNASEREVQLLDAAVARRLERVRVEADRIFDRLGA